MIDLIKNVAGAMSIAFFILVLCEFLYSSKVDYAYEQIRAIRMVAWAVMFLAMAMVAQ